MVGNSHSPVIGRLKDLYEPMISNYMVSENEPILVLKNLM